MACLGISFPLFSGVNKRIASLDSILESFTMAQLRERDVKRSLLINARLNGNFGLSAHQVNQVLQIKK